MKKSIAIIIFSLFFLTGCIDKVAVKKSNNITTSIEIDNVKYPEPQNVTIDGIDYLQAQTPIGKFGGVFITSMTGNGPKTFNPWESKDATSSEVASMLYDGLATVDVNTGEVIPKLAKKIEILPDKKTYKIYLRHGIKWSDGVPITADDVVFTWNDIIFKGFGNTSVRDSIEINGQLPTVRKIDDYTVEFVTPKPFAPFLRFISTEIAPKHTMEPVIKKGYSEFSAFMSGADNPKTFVTSGAFIIEEYKPSQRIIFKKNPNYYKIDKNGNKLPYLEKYIYVIGGNTNNQLLKFQSGEIDIISIDGANLTTMRLQENKPNSDFKIYNLGADTGTSYIVFNMTTDKNNDGKFYVDPIKQKWFNDKNFRTAVEAAIDRNSLILNIANGVGIPLYTAETSNAVFYNEKLPEPKYDIKKAEKLLKKSGFHKDNNGILFDKYGNKVEFNLYLPSDNIEREAVGVAIKEDLSKLGMTVNMKSVEFNTLVNKLSNTLDWDCILLGFTGSPLEPHGGLNVWNSNGPLHVFNKKTNNGFRKVSSWEKRLNTIFEQAALELDFPKRKILYDEYQAIVYEQKPLIYLYSKLRLYGLRTKFKNVYPTTYGGLIHNIDEIYVEE